MVFIFNLDKDILAISYVIFKFTIITQYGAVCIQISTTAGYLSGRAKHKAACPGTNMRSWQSWGSSSQHYAEKLPSFIKLGKKLNLM